MKLKTTLTRLGFYSMGMVLLALGITLNTKTELGVSAIVTIPYCIADLWSMNFGNVTFVVYTIFVLIQIAVKRKNTGLFDILQIAISLIFTRLLNLFGTIMEVNNDSLIMKLLLLLIAIVLTGVGAAMSMNARLVANPADGLVQTIADITGLEMGLVKNILDITCIVISVVISLIFGGRLIGIGIGTVLAALGIGRVIWIYNRLLKRKIEIISGLEKRNPVPTSK